jgi:hypothetical protein
MRMFDDQQLIVDFSTFAVLNHRGLQRQRACIPDAAKVCELARSGHFDNTKH